MTEWSHDEKLEFEKQYIQELRPVFHRRALFSDTTGDYVIPAEPKLYEKVRIRFRTAKDNVDVVYLCVSEKRFKMTKVSRDEMFDYYETAYQLGTGMISYYFEIHVGRMYAYYDVRGLVKEPDERMCFRVIPGFATPNWAKGAVMYQIYVDRFFNGDPANDVETNEYMYINDYSQRVTDWYKYPAQMGVREFYGGDLQGVLDKMDYLQELGIEVIYFNPLFVSPSNHKYDIQDYDYIDPHIGRIVEEKGELLQPGQVENRLATKYINRVSNKKNLEASNELFVKVVEEAHKRGIKVIMDGVFNHCGSFNKWMDRERIYENASGYANGAYVSAQSPYRSFFKFKSTDKWPYNETYEGWWGHDTLPKLNYEESKQLEDYILYVGQKWVSAPYNVDGWRLDVAADLGNSPEYNHEFWRKFRKKIKSANPNALILAEHYGDTRPWLQGNEWDSVMNYDAFMEPLTWFLTGMQKHSDSFDPKMLGDADAFWNAMAYHSMTMPSAYTAMNELSNHDHSRFLTRTSHKVGRVTTISPEAADEGIDTAVMREAVVVQMTWPGAPTVYYGDEAGLCGFTDPDNRRSYPWGKEDHSLLAFHKEMIAIHKKHQELKMGSLMRLQSDHNFLSYGRFDSKGVCVVAVNNREESLLKMLSVWELGIPMDARLTRLILSTESDYTTKEAVYSVQNGKLLLELPANSAIVLKYEK